MSRRPTPQKFHDWAKKELANWFYDYGSSASFDVALNVLKEIGFQTDSFEPNAKTPISCIQFSTNKALESSIQLDLSVAGYKTLGDLMSATAKQIRKINGIGPKAIGAIQAKLHEFGIDFKPEPASKALTHP